MKKSDNFVTDYLLAEASSISNNFVFPNPDVTKFNIGITYMINYNAGGRHMYPLVEQPGFKYINDYNMC